MIRKLVTCDKCGQFMDAPIILPCSNIFCKSHVDELQLDKSVNSFKCYFCNKKHDIPENGFEIYKKLMQMVESRAHLSDYELDLENKLEVLYKNVNDLQTYIERSDKESEAFLAEKIGSIKSKIEMEVECLKSIIDLQKDSLFHKLKQFEHKCSSTMGELEFGNRSYLNEFRVRMDLSKKIPNKETKQMIQLEIENKQNELNNTIKNIENLKYYMKYLDYETGRFASNITNLDLLGSLNGDENTFRLINPKMGAIENPILDTEQIIEIIRTNKDLKSRSLLQAVQSLRKKLSNKMIIPVNDIIHASLIEKLVSFMDNDQNAALQFESVWAMAYILSDKSAKVKEIVNSGAIPKLVKLLASSNVKVCDEALFALNHLASNSEELKDLAKKFGIFQYLIALIKIDTPYSLLIKVISTLLKYLSVKSPPPQFTLEHIYDKFSHLLLYSNDMDVLKLTLNIFIYVFTFMKKETEMVDHELEAKCLKRLVKLLSLFHKKDSSSLCKALQCINHIGKYSNELKTCIIESTTLEMFADLLVAQNFNTIHENVLTILSEMTNEEKSNTQKVIESLIKAQLVPALIEVLQSNKLSIQKLGARVIYNYITNAKTEHVLYLLQCKVLPSLVSLLVYDDHALAKMVLDGLYVIFVVAKKLNIYEKLQKCIESIDGLSKIKKLTKSNNKLVKELASRLMHI